MTQVREREPVMIDGNEAVASVAYRLGEVIAIYPITPASPLGELAGSHPPGGGNAVRGLRVRGSARPPARSRAAWMRTNSPTFSAVSSPTSCPLWVTGIRRPSLACSRLKATSSISDASATWNCPRMTAVTGTPGPSRATAVSRSARASTPTTVPSSTTGKSCCDPARTSSIARASVSRGDSAWKSVSIARRTGMPPGPRSSAPCSPPEPRPSRRTAR